ncbi:MAG: hemolysin family protein [Bacteroidales bacterium]|jgi:CBS domain containing-hemolysin-like protein|nr:hemolysin family protein [Bacteroidales bacterium]MDD6960826.1 hemolysin family protein [Bacteroidales bacterium]MDY6186138.1 hemolysin family protein [Muribaculaceae bacterium]
MEIWIIVTLVSLLFSGLFSGAEMAFVTSDRVRVEIDVKQGGIIGRVLRRFYANPQFFISSILVGNNIVLVIYGMGAAKLLDPLQEPLGIDDGTLLLMQTIASTIVIIITGEFLPKTIFRINPNASMRFIAIPIFLFYIILYPIALLATAISRGLMRLFGLKSDQVEIKMISVSDLNDYLEDTIDSLHDQKETVGTEVKMFQNALDFSNTHLRDCMIPRNEIVAAKSDITYDELSKLFTSSGRSKILIYREDIDDIIGYIHVSELFDPTSDWRKHIKPVLYAPEALLANKMMRRLLNEKRSMAIVVDEFGGTAGLVTLEDLVEEIFGDIQDEHDKAAPTARDLGGGIYEFSGRCEIADLNDTYHLDIPEEDDYQTLAGYILHNTGAIPEKGETITLGNLSIEVLRKSAARLELLRVTRIPSDEQ